MFAASYPNRTRFDSACSSRSPPAFVSPWNSAARAWVLTSRASFLRLIDRREEALDSALSAVADATLSDARGRLCATASTTCLVFDLPAAEAPAR